MKFTSEEINLARRLKKLGLSWQPAVGHYVWDEVALIDCESPFHDRVFYILDMKHFLRRAKSIENLRHSLCWLPTWFDCRQILARQGVSESAIAGHLASRSGIENQSERICLYELIEKTLSREKQFDPLATTPNETVF